MTREPLPARRDGITMDLVHALADGNHTPFTVTFGFDEQRQVREVFCLSRKSGTDLQSLLHQACIAISVGLQHGATMEELRHTLGEGEKALPPRSIVGCIVRAGAMLDAERLNADIHEFPKPAREAAAIIGPESGDEARIGASPLDDGSHDAQAGLSTTAEIVTRTPAQSGVTAGETAPPFTTEQIEAAVERAIPLKDDALEIPAFLRRAPERQYVDMTGLD